MDSSQTISIIIADDHPLLLKGLGDFLRARGYNVIKQIANGSDALREIIDHEPDFAILDIEMPYLTGLEVATKVIEKGIKTYAILLSYQIEPTVISVGMERGIKGFMLKEDAMSKLEECFSIISAGGTYVSATLALKKNDPLSSLLQDLTPSELKILKRIASGLSSSEIADLFNISERTVEKHRSNLIKKLALESGQFSLLKWVGEHKKVILEL